MITDMVTHGRGKQPRRAPPTVTPRPPGYLYIREHMDAKGLSVETVAKRMGVNRVTVHRYQQEQRRLNPEKVARLARAIGVEPVQLNYPPGRPSVDAYLKGVSASAHKTAFDVVKTIIRPPPDDEG